MERAYVVLADGETRVVLEHGNTWRIGRGDSNAVVIPDDLVSRNHALLQRTESGEYILIDMGSRNGSFVNGVRVSIPAQVKDGDTITMGPYTISFHQPSGVAAKATPDRRAEAVATKGFFAPHLTTVLVVDVRDFTRLTQSISEELLCQMIGTWFREGGLIMQQQGSWAQKYIGDALMAVWVHMKSDPQREIVEIMRALGELARLTATLHERYDLPAPIRIGAGLNSGLASVGNAGSRDIGDYTALGDTVNAAFRIESSTKEIGTDIAIGQQTYEMLRKSGNFDTYFTQQTVNLKGYEKPRPVWAITFSNLDKYLADMPVASR